MNTHWPPVLLSVTQYMTSSLLQKFQQHGEGGRPSRNHVPKEDSTRGSAMHGERGSHTTCTAGSRKGCMAMDSRHHRGTGTGRVPTWGCGRCPGQGPLQPPRPSITHTLGCRQGLVCPPSWASTAATALFKAQTAGQFPETSCGL